MQRKANGADGQTRFVYDVRGRLIRITDPLGGTTIRAYTPLGQSRFGGMVRLVAVRSDSVAINFRIFWVGELIVKVGHCGKTYGA